MPRRLYDGDGVFDNIVTFVLDNRDTIQNIASVASTVADAVGMIGTNTIDVVKTLTN